jgi:hypothetical protein
VFLDPLTPRSLHSFDPQESSLLRCTWELRFFFFFLLTFRLLFLFAVCPVCPVCPAGLVQSTLSLRPDPSVPVVLAVVPYPPPSPPSSPLSASPPSSPTGEGGWSGNGGRNGGGNGGGGGSETVVIICATQLDADLLRAGGSIDLPGGGSIRPTPVPMPLPVAVALPAPAPVTATAYTTLTHAAHAALAAAANATPALPTTTPTPTHQRGPPAHRPPARLTLDLESFAVANYFKYLIRWGCEAAAVPCPAAPTSNTSTTAAGGRSHNAVA